MFNSVPILITGPTAPVMTRDEVKRHLVVTFDDDDTLIDEITAAAAGMIDPAAGGWLGRSLRPQTWELRRSAFVHHHHDHLCPREHTFAIELPYPPLISIVSVKYDDLSGVEQTLDPSQYRVLRMGGRGRQLLAPAFGAGWPQARCAPESVRIQFTCGYPPAAEANGGMPAVVDQLPQPIKHWLKLVISSLYQNRESFVSGRSETVTELPPHIVQMITPYRCYG